MTKKFVFFFLISILPHPLPAKIIKDGAQAPHTPPELSVTEIRRVMADDIESKDAREYAMQAKIENLPPNLKGEYVFTIYLKGSDESSVTSTKQVSLESEETVTIAFSTTMPDDLIEQLVLLSDADKIPLGMWHKTFNIKDTEARVAVIEGDHVRVTTGTLPKLTVPGKDGPLTCESANSPCYYSRDIFEDFPPNIERCIPLTDESNDALTYCDDTISEQFPLKDEPIRILSDKTELNLRYSTTNNSHEVLIVENTGALNDIDVYQCSNNNISNNGCSVRDLQIENDVNFTVIAIDENGFVDGSSAYFFKNMPLDAWYLTEDVVYTKWTSEMEGIRPSIKMKSDLDNDLYSSKQSCELELCEFLFTISATSQNSEYLAVITIGNNSVATTISEDEHEDSRVLKISKTADPDMTTFSVNGPNPIPSEVKLIEVKGADKAVTNTLYNGSVTEGSSSVYEYATKDDIGFEGSRNFLLVEYVDDKATRAAEAFLILDDFDVALEWISGTKILRERVLDDKTVTIGSESCNNTSPCYHSKFDADVNYVSLCTQAINSATDPEETVEVCAEKMPESFEELPVTKLQLKEEDEKSQILLSASVIPESDELVLVLYDSSGQPLDQKEIMCNRNNETICIAESLPQLSSSSEDLNVVVVHKSGDDMISSSVVEVQYLKFDTSKLSEDSMVVHWEAANAEEYVATLTGGPGMLSGLKEEMSSDISCDKKSSCYSTFFHLVPTIEYQLSVHKNGDHTSSTDTDILPLEDQTGPEGNPVQIIKVSRISDNNTKIVLNERCDHLYIQVLTKMIDEQLGTSDISGEATAADSTREVYEFTHSVPIFDKKKEAMFTLLDKEDETLTHTGTADLQLEHIDSRVAWIGAKRDTEDAALRVDVGTQDRVQLGSLSCDKENSPCYFMEVKSSDIPEVLERCIQASPTTLQCDEEVTPFEPMEKKDVSITLEDDVLNVVAPISKPGSQIELKIYDPNNPKTEYSKGSVSCEVNKLRNEDSAVCTQPVQIPNDKDDIKVIVTEVIDKGASTKSIIMDFNVSLGGVAAWVIAVAVFGSLLVVGIGSYVTAVLVKQKKSRDWKNRVIEKKVNAIKNIYNDASPTSDDSSSQPSNGSITERNITLPERNVFSQRSPSPPSKQSHFQGRRYPRENRDEFYVDRFSGRSNQHILPPTELLERRPAEHSRAPYQSGHHNRAYMPSESESFNYPAVLPKARSNLSSRISTSSLQNRMSQFQQTRI